MGCWNMWCSSCASEPIINRTAFFLFYLFIFFKWKHYLLEKHSSWKQITLAKSHPQTPLFLTERFSLFFYEKWKNLKPQTSLTHFVVIYIRKYLFMYYMQYVLKTYCVIAITFTCLCLWKLVMCALFIQNCSLMVVVFPLPYELLRLEISMARCWHLVAIRIILFNSPPKSPSHKEYLY